MKPIENFLKVQFRGIDKYLKHFCNVKHVTRQKCFPNGPKPKSSKHLVTEFEYSSWLYYWRSNSFSISKSDPSFVLSHVEGFENIVSLDILNMSNEILVCPSWEINFRKFSRTWGLRGWPELLNVFRNLLKQKRVSWIHSDSVEATTRCKTITQNDQRELKCLIFGQN